MSLKYTASGDQLAEADIYMIEDVLSLKIFLKDSHPLFLIHDPKWRNCNSAEMIRITGKDRFGNPDLLWLVDASGDMGRTKGYLDQNLLTPYIFIPWRKIRGHLFRLCCQHRIQEEFPDFDSALNSYLPAGFTPEKSYRRKYSVMYLWVLSMRRRYLLKELVSVLSVEKGKINFS